MKTRIMILAGEISGDMHGAALLGELKKIFPGEIEAYGIGGEYLKAEGVELYEHADKTAVIGFWEVAKRFFFFRNLLKKTVAFLDSRRPDMLLTVDYPGFNLRVAAEARKRGIKTVHYICPQVWAWHRERIPKIAAVLDKLITIFPFEPPLFNGTGLDAVFAGHPLVDRAAETMTQNPPDLEWGPGHRIALFPGSRPNEIRRLLPDIVAGAAELEKRIGPCSFLIPSPTPATAEMVKEELNRLRIKPAHIRTTLGSSRHALLQAEAAAAKSGTGTLEASLLLCPCVIVYRLSYISYRILKHAITGISHIGLPNIVAGREVCSELIQSGLTPRTLADELEKIVKGGAKRDAALAGLKEVNAALGGPGAAARAAAAVAGMLPASLS